MRTIFRTHIDDAAGFRGRLLEWSRSFRECLYLDSNAYPQRYTSFDCALAADAFTSIRTDSHNAFGDLEEYRASTADWIFGYLSYDLKNDTEDLSSENFDGLNFPDLFFFQPKKLFFLRGNELEMQYLRMCDDEIESDLGEILSMKPAAEATFADPDIKQRTSRDRYIAQVTEMRAHISRGDIYEANFCMEFYAEDAQIDPISVFSRLNEISVPPFAAYFRNADNYLVCASPERFLRRQGRTVVSQPIKGTARRSADPASDAAIAETLVNSEKERSENIMIVDLVRNDLSKTADKGSVEVEELCGLYSFRQVHHLVSTVVARVSGEVNPVELIKSAFPMGSMTGAPKISAMNIIEKLESTRRGLYSGSIGYFSPDGDFDFNVVIRSILYNAANRYLSFSVGSAITHKSDPHQEYEECLLKARAMHLALKN